MGERAPPPFFVDCCTLVLAKEELAYPDPVIDIGYAAYRDRGTFSYPNTVAREQIATFPTILNLIQGTTGSQSDCYTMVVLFR